MTVTPATGYRLATLVASPSIVFSSTGNTRAFTMPAATVTVTAVFDQGLIQTAPPAKIDHFDNMAGETIGTTFNGWGSESVSDTFGTGIFEKIVLPLDGFRPVSTTQSNVALGDGAYTPGAITGWGFSFFATPGMAIDMDELWAGDPDV